MNNDREKDYQESNKNKQKIIIISLIAVLTVLLITVVVIAVLFIKKQNRQGSDPLQTETTKNFETTKNNGNQSASDTESVYSTINTTVTTIITEKSTTETEVQEPEKEHGFVINSMGYTYLYYGQGFEQFNGTSATAKRYASALNTIKENLPENLKLYSIVAPTSVAFSNIPREIRVEDDFSNSDQKNNIDTINSNLENIIGLNVFSALKEHENEKLYFNTDRNWTALASYYAYAEFCKEAGIEPVLLESLEKTQIEGYLGSFYNATKSSLLLENADLIECWLIDRKFPVNMTMYSNGLSYSNRQLVTTQISSTVSYGFYAFLGGPGERFEIKTDNNDAKKILVIGDSSAFPFVPFLAANYSEIFFINAESYSVNENNVNLQTYIENKNIDEALFISYATNTQRSSYCTKMVNLCYNTEMVNLCS